MTFISQITSQVPSTKIEQSEILELFCELMKVNEDRKLRLLFSKLKKSSGVSTRYSCLPQEQFQSGAICDLSTAARQKIYEQSSTELIRKLATKFTTKNITNIITVSCTGYQTPGLDFDLIDALNLGNNIFRYHLGAMGCYAGIIALRLASHLKGRTLILCLELCSLHFQKELSFSSVSSNSLFADGAVLLELNEGAGRWKTLAFKSVCIPNTLDKMSWLLRDTGFVMGLSPEVPNIINQNIKTEVLNWLNEYKINLAEINHWIIHPGGSAILDSVQKALELSDSEIELSRTILRDYGNMSSGTVFFILEKLLSKPKDKILMMAFGPGLTVEMALLEDSNA